MDNFVAGVGWLVPLPWTTGPFDRLRAFKLAKSEMTSLVGGLGLVRCEAVRESNLRFSKHIPAMG